MLCCGEERSSRFCPNCGKALGEARPVDELLAHCRKVEAMHWTRARGIRKRIAAGSTGYCDTERDAAHSEKIAARWGGWADALAALMEGRDDG